MEYEKRQKLKNVLRYLWMAFVGLITVYVVYSLCRYLFWDGVLPHPRISFFVLAPVMFGNLAWLNIDSDFIDALPVLGLQCSPDEEKRFRITVSYFF